MIKTLTKHGNSYALVIDKPILELLRVSPETPFEIMTDGQTLVLTPVRDPAEDQKFLPHAARFTPRATRGPLSRPWEARRSVSRPVDTTRHGKDSAISPSDLGPQFACPETAGRDSPACLSPDSASARCEMDFI